MRPFLGVCLLVLVAVAAMGQSGTGRGGPVQLPVQTGRPSSPEDGEMWLRKTDLQTFFYSDSLDKWLGELVQWEYGYNGASYSGFLRCNPRMLSDTTTGAEVGYFADGAMRIMKAHLTGVKGSPVTGQSTYIYADQSVLMKFDWNAKNYVIALPSADSSTGWVAPSERVVVSSGVVISAEQVTGSVAQNNPLISIFLREEVTP